MNTLHDPKKPSMNRTFDRLLVLGLVLWTAMIAGMLAWHLKDTSKYLEQLAHEASTENIAKDILYRSWAAEHGGVYVPVTDRTPPNPYLKDVKERDITTPSGRRLTLVNPAYMTRQVHEMSRSIDGVIGHITSLRPIRPENGADAWEARALTAIEGGQKEFGEITLLDGDPYYRHMIPLYVEKPCLKCHAAQGYKLGDLRGGISAAIPMKEFDAIAREHTISEVRHFGAVWLLGLAGMLLARPYIRQRIDEREHAVVLLEESEQRMRSIVDNAPFGAHLYRLEKDGRLVFTGANASADRILSLDNRQFIGMTIEEAFPPLAGTHIPDTYRHIAATGKQVEFEQVAHSGHEIRGVFDVHAFQTAPNQVAVFFRDITDRKKAENARRESEERFRTIVDTALEGIVTIDRNSVITFTNARMLQMLGYSREEFLGRSILEFVHEEERPDHERQLALRRSGLATEYERRFLRRNGTVIWTRASASPLFDEQGAYNGAFGMYSDVTERKRTELALRDSEEQLRVIFEASQAGIIVVGPQGMILYANQRMADMFRCPLPELIGLRYPDLVHPSEKSAGDERMRQLIRGDIQAVSTERLYIRRDGSDFWGFLSGKRMENPDGSLRALVGMITDITERKQAEEALRESEEQFRLILNSTGEAIYGINEAGTCTFCNPACVRLLGYQDQNELLGRNMHAIMHHTRKDGTRYPLHECKVVGTIEHGAGAHITDEVFWRADGTSFPVEYWSYPQVRNGRIVGAVVTFVEITERLRLEDQLRQAQKMEAVGTLAGGIAHDFNNIMMAIMGYAHLLKMGPSPELQDGMAVDEIISAAERAAQLTQGLLAFSRKQVMRRTVLDLNEVVRTFRNMIGRMLREDIELHLQVSRDSVMVDADRGQLEQVLMNLFTNARDAMPKGGRIYITTGVREIQAAETGRYYVTAPGRYACISVSDTGQGMAGDTLEHIFEPFFTTKEVGKGTGLGLSMVYGIMKKHSGSVIVSSEIGKGTTVSLHLPLAHAQPAEASEENTTGRLKGSELVLVVEDDEAVRMVVRDILARHGYAILEAADGARGVELFRQHEQEIGLVISDLVMPNRSGWDMALELKELRPDVKVLFLSGYDRSMVPDQSGTGEVHFLQKPLRPNDLLAKVREMLDA